MTQGERQYSSSPKVRIGEYQVIESCGGGTSDAYSSFSYQVSWTTKLVILHTYMNRLQSIRIITIS